jgi:hypothetical protein
VDPLDPNHDATMRIEGEGSEAAAAHSFSRCRDHGGTAGYRYLGSFLAFRRYARRGAKPCIASPVADYAAECSLKPSGMRPSFA